MFSDTLNNLKSIHNINKTTATIPQLRFGASEGNQYTDTPVQYGNQAIKNEPPISISKFETPHVYMNVQCSTQKFNKFSATNLNGGFNEYAFSVLFVKTVLKSLQQSSLCLLQADGFGMDCIQNIKINSTSVGNCVRIDASTNDIFNSLKVFVCPLFCCMLIHSKLYVNF